MWGKQLLICMHHGHYAHANQVAQAHFRVCAWLLYTIVRRCQRPKTLKIIMWNGEVTNDYLIVHHITLNFIPVCHIGMLCIWIYRTMTILNINILRFGIVKIRFSKLFMLLLYLIVHIKYTVQGYVNYSHYRNIRWMINWQFFHFKIVFIVCMKPTSGKLLRTKYCL